MSILSKGIGKDPINTQEPFNNEQELRENLNMQSPPPSEAPNDWKSNSLDMGSVSPSIGARALGGLVRKAIDFVPNTFDPDNENRNLALAGLNFLGPSNFLTGQSAWNAGVGSLQATFNQQAKTARETAELENQLEKERLSQGAQDARAEDKREFDADQNQRNRENRRYIAGADRDMDETILKMRLAADIEKQGRDRAAQLVKDMRLADKDQTAEILAQLELGFVPGPESGIPPASRKAALDAYYRSVSLLKDHNWGETFMGENDKGKLVNSPPNWDGLLDDIERANTDEIPYQFPKVVDNLYKVFLKHAEEQIKS